MRAPASKKSLICEYCGQPFTASRAHAKFCDDLCRKRMSRHPQVMKDHKLDALRAIDYLKMGRTRSDYETWIGHMREIASHAQRMIELAEAEKEEKIGKWYKTMKP